MHFFFKEGLLLLSCSCTSAALMPLQNFLLTSFKELNGLN